MPRPALSLLPTYEHVSDNQDAYVSPLRLRQLARTHGRYWSFNDCPTTVAMNGNRYAKSLNSFQDHRDEASFMELLREYADNGVARPSGYADVFHEHFYSPRVSWSVNSMFANCFAGGWQQATGAVVNFGTYRRYDLKSAYLWAATLGLPDTRTYTRSLSPWKTKHDGLYRVKLLETNPLAPFPFNTSRECLATNREIELYSLKIAEVIEGVVWKNTIPGSRILDAIKKVSTWKQAGRAYWGRWAQVAKVDCVARYGERRWQLPNVALNIPWAHMIVSRVKERVWENARRAVHVYVDSVITSEELPTGNDLGDWRLEKVYPHGVVIKGTGQYGCLLEHKLEKMAGVSINSHLRQNPLLASA